MAIYDSASIVYGKTSQRGWDMSVSSANKSIIRYQVKTVSAFSKTRRISPIHPGWDYLILVYLDRRLYPVSMWEIRRSEGFGHDVVRNKTMPYPGVISSGSDIFSGRIDVTTQFKDAYQVVSRNEFTPLNLIEMFVEAIALVDDDYYSIETTYKPSLIRERLFCYELYHQLRLILRSIVGSKLRLHGEIDKRGHKLFEQRDWKNPDFIIHSPGTMKENLLVCEVKGDIRDASNLAKDIKTVRTFVGEYEYRMGLLVIFGNTDSAARHSLERALNSVKHDGGSPKILDKIAVVIAENSEQVNTYLLSEIIGSK